MIIALKFPSPCPVDTRVLAYRSITNFANQLFPFHQASYLPKETFCESKKHDGQQGTTVSECTGRIRPGTEPASANRLSTCTGPAELCPPATSSAVRRKCQHDSTSTSSSSAAARHLCTHDSHGTPGWSRSGFNHLPILPEAHRHPARLRNIDQNAHLRRTALPIYLLALFLDSVRDRLVQECQPLLSELQCLHRNIPGIICGHSLKG